MSEPVLAQETCLPNSKKVLIGGLGALTPIIINLLVVDLEVVFQKVTFIVALTYAIRVIVLFYVGGLVACLHKNEHDQLKLFELGIAAPALLTALINAQVANGAINASNPARETSNEMQPARDASPGVAAPQGFKLSFISAAYASPPPPAQPSHEVNQIKVFSPPEETLSEQAMRGLFGATSQRVWFVVVGSYANLENATRHAATINGRWPEFKADVFQPYDTPYYSVVIGANLELKEAMMLENKARSSGLARDIYIKRGPDTAQGR